MNKTYKYGKYGMVGLSKPMIELYDTIYKVACTDATVLIRGERGTGKELVAKAIHKTSKRSNKPYVIVNCAAIPKDLLESELFGHEKGSFTNAYQRRLGKFETANSGTLFLDEIADLSPELQPKILRAIEYKSFERIGGNEMIHSDVRVIAATSKDLEKLVEEDKFRPELYDRLNVIPIYIPPLRDRKDDIPLLIEYFMKALGSSKKIKGDVLKQFLLYDWPGNVRELKCVVERLVIMSEGDEITLYDVEKYWKKCDYTCDNSTHTNHLEDEMKCMFLPQTIAKIANCKLESILKIGRKKWPEIKYYVSGDGLHLIHIDDAIEFFKATDKPEMAERLRRYREEI